MGDGDVKKFCASCRYNKCLAVGMKPDQVLSESGIKERFKYFQNCRYRYNSRISMPSTEDENPLLISSADLELSNLFASTQNTPQESMERENSPEFKRVSVIIKNPQKEKEGNKKIDEVSVLEKNILPTINVDELEATEINEVFNNINLSKDQEDDSLICKYIHKKFRKL